MAILKPDQRKVPGGPFAACPGIDALKLQPEFDIVDDVQPRQQGVLLKHHAAIGPRPHHGLAPSVIRPVVGAMKPAIRFSSVVLPHPDAPRATTKSPL